MLFPKHRPSEVVVILLLLLLLLLDPPLGECSS
jgi:hypothetical protein